MQTNIHKQLLVPLEIEDLIALTVSQEELDCRLGLGLVIVGDIMLSILENGDSAKI